MYQPPQNPDEPMYTPPQQPSYPQQTPQQGYPPQQPYYPPSYVPPPQKKSRTWLWIVLGVLAVLILGCIGVSTLVLRSAGTAINTVSTSVASTVTVVSTPTSAPSTANSIGKPVVVNSDWTVTLNKASTNTGSEFDKPKAGDIFLVVNVTLHNTSSTTQQASSAIQWSLKDSTGQTYTQDITFGNGPDGTIAAGGLLRGNIAYDVPKSIHSFILQFVAGIGSSDLVEWNVSI